MQGSSNSNHAKGNESQLSGMLFIAWHVVIAQHKFSRQRWKVPEGPCTAELMTKYLMIFSHCIV